MFTKVSAKIVVLVLLLAIGPVRSADAGLRAGAARIDVTDRSGKPENDTLYVKALVLQDDAQTVVLITVDAVAIGEIGPIKNSYLPNVRTGLSRELKILPANVIINASHCHGIVCQDVDVRTIDAVKQAYARLEPVKAGGGVGVENRIMENRRLRLKDGREGDVRHAYSLNRDEDIAAIGPTDPEIGLLRIDRMNGEPLAAIYQFACHPIQGVPGGGNTADYPGFASKVIEENLGPDVVALFLQGCGGDINPVRYKDTHTPRDAEPLGNLLGLSAMRGLRAIKPQADVSLRLIHESLALPWAADYEHRISVMEEEQQRLLRSLKGTSLNFKSFMTLFVQYRLFPDFPLNPSHEYEREKAIGRDDVKKLDEENRRNVDAYASNIQTMEELTRLQTNLNLLRKHLAQKKASAQPTFNVEVNGLRIGDFVLITFPGELTVEIGLELKKNSPRDFTFISGYTNGYIYYTPTEAQRQNPGYAQEDCDTLVSPEWRALFDKQARSLMKQLE